MSGDDGRTRDVGEGDRRDLVEFRLIGQHVGVLTAREGFALDEAFARVRRGEAGLDADAIGTEESFGEIVELQVMQGFRADDGLGDSLEAATEQEDLEALEGQSRGMGQPVCHVDGLAFLQEVHHVQGRGAGVDVDEVLAGHKAGRPSRDGDLLFGAVAALGRHIFFHRGVVAVDGGRAAVDLVEHAALVERGQVAPDGGFRCAERPGELGDCHSLFLFEDAQDGRISFFRKHGFHPFCIFIISSKSIKVNHKQQTI